MLDAGKRLLQDVKRLFRPKNANRSNDQESARNRIRLRFLQREKLAWINTVIAKLDPRAGHVLIANQVGTHSFAIHNHSVDHAIGPPQLVAGFRVQQFPAAQLTRNDRSEEHTSELQSHSDLVCRLLLEKKK